MTVVATHLSPLRWALLLLIAGCATPPPAVPDDRYAVARMKNGPSLYETGRFAAVPVSSGGLHIEEGSIERASIERPSGAALVSAPARARSRRLSSRHAHSRKAAPPER